MAESRVSNARRALEADEMINFATATEASARARAVMPLIRARRLFVFQTDSIQFDMAHITASWRI